MVKLLIPIQTGNFIIIDQPNVVASDSATLQALRDSWALYNRSAGVYVNDSRVFMDQQNGEIYFATQLTLADAMPWRDFIGATIGGGDGGNGGGGEDPGGGGGGGGTVYTLSRLYRFILVSSSGLADTGANYPQCSIDNQPACQPMQFATLADAIDYAYGHGETPYRVLTAAETWDLISGAIPEDQGRILPPNQPDGGTGGGGGLSTMALLAIAGVAALLFGGRRSA